MQKEAIQKKSIFGRFGGLSLEAAIIIPLILVVVLFLVQATLLIRIEIVASNGLDNTADEISLLIPIVETAADGTAIGQSINDLGLEWLGSSDYEQLIKEAALDLASSLVLGRIIDQRFNFWLQKAAAKQELSINPVLFTQIQLHLNLEQNYLVLIQNMRISTLFGPINRSVKSAVPVWTGSCEHCPTEDQANRDKDAIWQMSNLARGRKIREIFDANLPFNYPVIAKYVEGNAVSITSIDTTAPTYENNENVIRVIRHKLADLSEFSGYQSRSIDYPDILASDIRTRKLLLVIPENSPDEFNLSIRQEIVNLGTDMNIQVQIVGYGNSQRYDIDHEGMAAN